MKQEQNYAFKVVFILVIAAYILVYILNKTANPVPPSDADLANYSTSLLQGQYPELYKQDPVFADGSFTQMMWASSYLYMQLFQGLHTVTGGNISQVMAFLQLIPSVASVLTFYWGLRVLRLDRWVTLMMAVGLSLWLLLLRYGDSGVPSLYYHACVPIFLRLIWEQLFEPSLWKKPVILWRVMLIGFLIGISPTLINSVNGLAFSLLTLVLATLQWLFGRMKWQPYAALLIGLVPILLVVSSGGTGGARTVLTDVSAANLVKTIPLNDFLDPSAYFQFYTLIFGMVLLSALYRWFRPSGLSKFIFLLTSSLFWLLPLGNATIIFFTYFLIRLIHRRDDWFDDVLIIALNVSIFIGPVLLTIVMGVWSLTHIHILVFIMWQMFRFHYFGYFIGGVVFLRMTVYLTESIPQMWLQRVTQLGIVLFIMRISYFKIPDQYHLIGLLVVLIALAITSQASTLFQMRAVSNLARGIGGVVLIAGVTVVTYILTRNGEFNGFSIAVLLTTLSFYTIVLIASAQGVKGWLVTGALLIAMWGVSVAGLNGYLSEIYDTDAGPYLSLSEEQANAYHQGIATKKQSIADFIELAEWLRDNTPMDSLTHWQQTNDLGRFFRYLSRRSLLFSWMDVVVGQFNHEVSERNQQIAIAAKEGNPGFVLWRIAPYDVDYVVFPTFIPILYPAMYRDSLILPVPVYKNSTYNLYKLETLSLPRAIMEVSALINTVR